MSQKVLLPKTLEGKTFLIAGAGGFVPSHVSEFYLNMGAEVIGVDNFITGSRSNVEILNKYDRFEFHEHNIYESLPDLSSRKMISLSVAKPLQRLMD